MFFFPALADFENSAPNSDKSQTRNMSQNRHDSLSALVRPLAERLGDAKVRLREAAVRALAGVGAVSGSGCLLSFWCSWNALDLAVILVPVSLAEWQYWRRYGRMCDVFNFWIGIFG
jgi:hypothetical protein